MDSHYLGRAGEDKLKEKAGQAEGGQYLPWVLDQNDDVDQEELKSLLSASKGKRRVSVFTFVRACNLLGCRSPHVLIQETGIVRTQW